MNDFAAAIADTPFALWAAGAAYPWINVAHVLGVVMLVGAVGVVDLRIAGAFAQVPARPLTRALTPVAVGGFAVVLVSGVPLFASDAVALAASSTFLIKLVLIAIAGINALAFRVLARDGRSDREAGRPASLRVIAIASLALWVGVIVCGRMIAYT